MIAANSSIAQLPTADSTDYLDRLLAICEAQKIDYVLPYADEEVRLISKNKKLFSDKNIGLICLEQAFAEIFSSKIKSYEFLERQGIACPIWFPVHSKGELLNSIDRAGNKDLVLKPALSRGGRGVFIIEFDETSTIKSPNKDVVILSRSNFIDKFLNVIDINANTPCVLMEKLSGQTLDVDILAWEGKLIRLYQRCRSDGFNPYKGYQFINNDLITQLIEKLIKNTGISGLFECDVMFDSTGMPYVIEINPRPSGGIAITAAAGDNLVDNIISLQEGDYLEAKLNFLIGTCSTYYKISFLEEML